MEERHPIPIREIIDALERESNTTNDIQWKAAQLLREISCWNNRTLMCRIDLRASAVSEILERLG